jgi:acyl-CoA synthetase (AMP-forming)/AMP-acid ligase II
MAVAFLGVASTAAAVPLRYLASAEETIRSLRDTRSRFLIVEDSPPGDLQRAASEAGLAVIRIHLRRDGPAGAFDLSSDSPSRAAPQELPRPDNAALVVQTSGTTGRPKVAPLYNRHLVLCAYANCEALRLTPSDRGLIIMPMSHISALRAELLAYLAAGGSAAWLEFPVSDDSIIAGLRDRSTTTLTASPFYYESVVQRLEATGEGIRNLSLRFFRSSSSGLSPALHARIEAATQTPVIEDYGSTEAGLIAMNPLPPGVRKAGSVGIPMSVELVIMSDAWQPAPRGETGEIVVRGATVFAGYDSPEDTQSRFRDGWLRTGDVGYLDADGYLFITGRLDELINRGGEKIDPAEVEKALLACDSVAEAAAFGVPDAKYGQEVFAAVVLKPGSPATAAGVLRQVRRTLARPFPRGVEIVEALPRTSTGKVRRRELASLLDLSKVSTDAPGG